MPPDRASEQKKVADAHKEIKIIVERITPIPYWDADKRIQVPSVYGALNDHVRKRPKSFLAVSKAKAAHKAPDNLIKTVPLPLAKAPHRAPGIMNQAAAFLLAKGAQDEVLTFTKAQQDEFRGGDDHFKGIDFNKVLNLGILVFGSPHSITQYADLPPPRSVPENRMIRQIENFRWANLRELSLRSTPANCGATFASRCLPYYWGRQFDHSVTQYANGKCRYVAFTNGETFIFLAAK